MLTTGIALAVLSGLFNGLFITSVKLESRWKGENIWLVEMVVSCLVMPTTMVFFSSSGSSVWIAWEFCAICFGKSVDNPRPEESETDNS